MYGSSGCLGEASCETCSPHSSGAATRAHRDFSGLRAWALIFCSNVTSEMRIDLQAGRGRVLNRAVEFEVGVRKLFRDALRDLINSRPTPNSAAPRLGSTYWTSLPRHFHLRNVEDEASDIETATYAIAKASY